MGRHLGFWGPPSWNFAWPACFFKRVGLEEYMYQISCLYHHLNDSCYFLHLSAPLKVFRASAAPLPARNTELRARAEAEWHARVSISWLPINPRLFSFCASNYILCARLIFARAWSLYLRARSSSICSENVPTRAPLISARV